MNLQFQFHACWFPRWLLEFSNWELESGNRYQENIYSNAIHNCHIRKEHCTDLNSTINTPKKLKEFKKKYEIMGSEE